MENLKDPRPAKIKPAISVCLEQHGKQDQWFLFPDFQRQPRKDQFPRPVEAQLSRPVPATGAEYVCHQPWWLPVGAVLHVWSPAEVCKFITLTVSDPPNPNYRPKPQNCLQSEASCSRPSQAPIPLNQDPGDGPGTLQQGAFARLLGSLPLIFPFVFFWGGFLHGKPASDGKQNKKSNSKMPSWEPWRAASLGSIPRGPLRALRSRVPRCLGLRALESMSSGCLRDIQRVTFEGRPPPFLHPTPASKLKVRFPNSKDFQRDGFPGRPAWGPFFPWAPGKSGMVVGRDGWL